MHSCLIAKYTAPFWMLSKAFDKVLISGLLWTLIQSSVPISLIQILFYWFNNLNCSVA